MSDYSKIAYETVSDIPPRAAYGAAKPLSPGAIFQTLPFLETMDAGQTIKIAIPADSFGYSMDETAEPNSSKYHASMLTGLTRTLKLLGEMRNQSYVARIVGGDLYVKKLDA